MSETWGRMRKKRKEESDERGERKENKKTLNRNSNPICMSA